MLTPREGVCPVCLQSATCGEEASSAWRLLWARDRLPSRSFIELMNKAATPMLVKDPPCTHLGTIKSVRRAKRRECDECVKSGSQWVHLRTCQECGATLCCDSSPNRHASKHAQASGHPVIASAEPEERWLYCYPDDSFAEY